jgi:two-component system CheB/CheR fusion protein
MVTEAKPTFPVIALGGSAGGLGAFFAFFDALEQVEERRGMAFVVILHLCAEEESHLAHLLEGRTSLPVRSVDERTPVEPGMVYVLPPDRTLGVEGGALMPRARAKGAAHHPVDEIFHAIAREFGDRAVAIVVSGTGSNGSSALGAIREAGGCTLVQSPETAGFDGMPRSAISTGLVDLVVPIAQMIPALQRNHRRLRDGAAPGTQTPGDASEEPEEDAAKGEAADDGEDARDPLERILRAVRDRNGIDFGDYKTGTLHRRIDRRASLQDAGRWDDYADLLESSPQDVDTLTGDLLISVTEFFRDGAAWDALRDKVLAPAIRDRAADDPLRIWSAGCATGQEAYSAAITALDLVRARWDRVEIDIFATDASADALARARQGRYPLAAVDDLPEGTRERWFETWDDTAQVRGELRDRIVFALHNMIQDPPFSRLDLILCRNVLIYLRPEVQRRLILLFHFALREGGCLFLGTSEGVSEVTDLFEPVDKAAHIWRRIGPTRHDLVEFPLVRGRSARPGAPERAEPKPPEGRRPERLAQQAFAVLAERHAPPALVVDRDLDVLYFHGTTDRFLKPRSGEATQNVLELARDGIAAQLRGVVEAAKGSGRPEEDRFLADLGGETARLRIEVAPMPGSDGRMLITFAADHPEQTSPKQVSEVQGSRERELEEKLRRLEERLAATARSASHNEEAAHAYNEEVTSMNEELRAANEELETSKEELQSLNEELRSVNDQQRETVAELRERTADLDNLLGSTGIATLFLDADLSVRWFSPGLRDLFHVREADISRPIGHVVRRFRDDALEEECRDVLRSLDRSERRVTSEQGRIFQRLITPYRTVDDRIAGVVVTFSDVTAIHEARRYAERIVETVPTPILVLDADQRVVSANPAFDRVFDVEPGQTEGRLIYQLGNGQWNIPELRRLLEDVLPDDERFDDYEVEHEFEKVGRKSMLLNGRRLDHAQLVLLTIEDVTERKTAEAHQAMLMGELGHRVKNAIAVVRGLASQTIRRSSSLEEFHEAFTGRLAAYAEGHTQLLNRDWRPGTLDDVVTGAVESHAVDPERIDIAGPAVHLAASEALGLGLILHELATNVAKYGALGDEGGRVSIAWSLENAGLRLTWTERGGPTVEAPENEGFGSLLIRQLAGYDLGGEASFSYDPEGLTCTIAFAPEGPHDA